MISSALLLTLLLTAALTDLHSRRIPNTLVGAGALFGFLLSLSTLNGFVGWQQSTTGLIAGLIIFLPFYLLGHMGAGDVKLLAMVGSFIGIGAVPEAALYIMLVGGFLAVLWQWMQRRFTAANPAKGSALPSRWLARLQHKVLADQRYPYAPAIAVGTCISLAVT